MKFSDERSTFPVESPQTREKGQQKQESRQPDQRDMSTVSGVWVNVFRMDSQAETSVPKGILPYFRTTLTVLQFLQLTVDSCKMWELKEGLVLYI